MNKKHILNFGFLILLSAIMVGSFGCSSGLSSKSCEGSALIGTWELTTVSSRGTRTRTLTINEDLTGMYQGRNREIPITDLKVEGDQVSFKMQRKFREREFTMEFKGTLDGASLKGQWITPRGSRDVTGKKVSTTP
jgi:hypothetical protein